MSFSSWLHQPEPQWKEKIETCDRQVFQELEVEKEEVIRILEVLEKHSIL